MNDNGAGRPTILLVDDDDEVWASLKTLLEGQGYRVTAACDERDAVERARHTPPDLILLEFGRVPTPEALAAGRRIRERAGLPAGVPVVAYADRADELVSEGGEVSVGPGEYVTLPEDGQQLLRFLLRLSA